MVWSCWYSDKIKAKLPSYPLVKTEELVWSGKRWDSDGLLRGSNYANLFYHEKYRIYQLHVQIFSHLHVLAWSNLISVSFILLLHIKIVHSILELFNFLLWNSASVYRIASFVFLHRNVLSTHIRKWYYHQNTVEFKESVANHFKLTLFEILPLTMGKNGVKIEKEEWNLTVNEILTYCFTCPSTFSTLIFLSGTSTAEVWESQVRQSAT